jgi:hypothetical protein
MNASAKLLPRDHAHAIAEAARNHLSAGLDDVQPRLARLSASGARYVGNLYRDYASLIEIAEHLNDGNETDAANAASRLDSVARDIVPHAAWAFLAERLADAR